MKKIMSACGGSAVGGKTKIFLGSILLGLGAVLLCITAVSADEYWSKDKSRDQVQNPTFGVMPDASVLSNAQTQIIVKMKSGEIMTVDVKSPQEIDEALEAWQNNPDVEYAELNGLVWALGEQTSWGYDTVRAATAATEHAATGSGVIVAVVDTGVDYVHEDLDANNWVNSGETPNNGIDDDANGYIDDVFGYDFIGSYYTSTAPDNDPQDEYGHGTHVSGIIAAEDNDVGIVGVAPSATIMPVKVLDAAGYGWDSAVANGIRYAVDNGANIINLSLGSSFATNTLKEAIDYAATNNVLVVAAAGNSNSYSSPSYPAVYASVISVAASNEDGYKTYWSNWGKADLTAPGDDILSSLPGNTYEAWSGTSMASPFVAGTAALVMQVHATNAKATRHILETEATDFGTQAGPDYVAGYGMLNALDATGTMAASAYLRADAGWLKTDTYDDVVLTVSVRNALGAAVVGDTVTWTTTHGTLSDDSNSTDANGEASVTLTSNDDTLSLAEITATPTSASATMIQIALGDDKVHPEAISIAKTSATYTEEYDENGNPIPQTTLSNNLFAAGDEVTIWAQATAFDKATHDATMTYAVTDPDGTAVTDLSGNSKEFTVGELFWGWFFPQTKINSKPLTIPSDAADGKYTLSVTMTDSDTGEINTTTSSFWVNEMPEVLVVDNNGGCADTSVEGWDFGGMTMCTNAGQLIADELTALGYNVMLWDTTYYSPTSADLSFFPVVIWEDAGIIYADSTTLQTYLDNGGNLLLTSEIMAEGYTYNGLPADFLWDYLHANYVSTIIQPDKVLDADGLAYNIDYYDLNGDGAHTTFYADELELNDADDAEAIFSYYEGNSTAKTAGIKVDNDTYRLVYLSFGLESINDAASGDATKAHFLTETMDWLLGDAPVISTISASSLKNNIDRSIIITGSGFQVTGTTSIVLGANELTSVDVIDRNTISATVPAGITHGTYDLVITSPDGRTVTETDAIRIKKGGAYIESVSPAFMANNEKKEIVITGQNFKVKSKVFLGKHKMHKVEFIDPAQLTVTVPADMKVKKYDVKVKNPHRKVAKLKKGFSVRLGFTEKLKVGDNHAQVKALEKRLKTYSYFTDDADTVFNAKTKEAMLLYQQAYGLEQSGILDTFTRYTLNNNE